MRRPRRPDAGSVLLVVLVVVLLAAAAALALLHASDARVRGARGAGDAVAALAHAESGVAEVLWRLDLPEARSPVPGGQLVTVNDLAGYPARIDWDPLRLLANGVDDDGDGRADEPDEIDLFRDWQARIVLARAEPRPGPPLEVADVSAAGPPWGSRVVLPTVQPAAAWLPYTTAAPAGEDVLLVRFLRDVDTAAGDAEGDGPEVVFHDPALAANGIDDRNTLTGLGGDGDPGNDSPLNVTWGTGAGRVAASGVPVLVVRSTGTVLRGARVVARRPIEVLVAGAPPAPAAPRFAACGCDALEVGGRGTDSYRSAEGSYGTAGAYAAGHAGGNRDLEVSGGAVVRGGVEAGGDVAIKGGGSLVTGDATAGGLVRDPTRVGGTVRSGAAPRPAPCTCDGAGARAGAAAAAAANSNGSILPNNLNPYVHPSAAVDAGRRIYRRGTELDLGRTDSVILAGGTYLFESIDVGSDAVVQVGIDADRDGLVDRPPAAPVTVHVTGDVRLTGRGRIAALRPGDLRLVLSGDRKVLEMKDDSRLDGIVVAPLGEAKLSGRSQVFGSVTALELKTSGDSWIHLDETPPAPGAGSRHRVVSWREVE